LDDSSSHFEVWTVEQVADQYVVGEHKNTITMYGLSFTASLVCASATRRFASETRRAISSMARVLPGAGEPVAGVGPLETVGEELSVVGGSIGTAALVGTGALMDGVHPNVEDFIAASLAAISARFCAMRSVLDSCENHVAVSHYDQPLKVSKHSRLQRVSNHRYYSAGEKRL
jgi:hypothetical protein